jgi:hypothetical protein
MVAVIALAGCGTNADDADDVTAAPEGTGEPGEVDGAFCDAALRLGNPGEPEVDWETATEDEMAAAEQVFGEQVLRQGTHPSSVSPPERTPSLPPLGLARSTHRVDRLGDGRSRNTRFPARQLRGPEGHEPDDEHEVGDDRQRLDAGEP